MSTRVPTSRPKGVTFCSKHLYMMESPTDSPFYISVTPTARSNLSKSLQCCGMDLELWVSDSYLPRVYHATANTTTHCFLPWRLPRPLLLVRGQTTGRIFLLLLSMHAAVPPVCRSADARGVYYPRLPRPLLLVRGLRVGFSYYCQRSVQLLLSAGVALMMLAIYYM